MTYTDLLAKRIPIIFDGALGTQIQKKNLATEAFGGYDGCNEALNFTRADVITSIHEEYLRAGAHVVETNTFGGSRLKLKEYRLENEVYKVNKAGAEAARKAIQNCSDILRPMFVCGTIGPTGVLLSSKSSSDDQITFDTLSEVFLEQAEGLIDGGADLILIETSQDLLEVRAAVIGIKKAFKNKNRFLPLQIQVTMDASGRMLLGSTVEAFLGAVISLGPTVIGLNCSTGPEEMAPFISKLLELSPVPVAMLPNAGMPENIDGNAVYKMKPTVFGNAISSFVTQKGLSVAGGCCGTNPEHIAALAKSLEGKIVASRTVTEPVCFLATGLSGTNIENVKKPVIIGERLNTQGSKKTKELLLSENYDELYHIAVEQSENGSSLLDICVAVSEKDNEKDAMRSVVQYLTDRIYTPLCIDSTEPAVMEAALKVSQGSVMLNSINLEHDGNRARKILALARDFGCPVVALTIDDEGMAKTVVKKVALTRRLRDLVVNEFGLPEHFIYIDPLVFTLATGDAESANAAKDSLDALRKIKAEFPGIRTAMGVSNVSFGLKPKARRILNNLMLHYAVEAGLDAAIFNPLHRDDIDTYDKDIRSKGEDLLFNRNQNALFTYVNLFEERVSAELVGKDKKVNSVTLPAEKRLHNAVVNRDRRDLDLTIRELLNKKSAAEILNEILLPAMANVGEKMAAGEMILPFVLQAAEVMKDSLKILEPHLKKDESSVKGTIVLATVYGDVHDIGKNLVSSILSNQGYRVIDLGKQVPLEVIIKTVKEEKPDAVGLSALLVTTSRQMAECVVEFDKQGISVPILIGGAAVNAKYAERISGIGDGKHYSGGVFFAKDAFEAARILEQVKKHGDIKQIKEKLSVSQPVQAPESNETPSLLEYGYFVEPPFWGTGDMLVWDTATLLSSVDKQKVFKARWGGGKLSEEAYKEAVKNDFEPIYEKLTKEIIENNLIDPRGFYGFFPVYTNNDVLYILDPTDYSTELQSFQFPRVSKHLNRSIADFFRPEGDTISLQVVTIGKAIGDRCRDYFQKEERYSYGFMLNALANHLVEMLAEKVTTEIRHGLGIPVEIGKRYSFGYPGLPDLVEQKKLFDLLSVEERLGITLTTGFQMEPEHSTLGFFCHHPNAEYLV